MITKIDRFASELDGLETLEFDEANDDVFEGLAAMHSADFHREIDHRLAPRRRPGRPRKALRDPRRENER